MQISVNDARELSSKILLKIGFSQKETDVIVNCTESLPMGLTISTL